MQPNYKANTAFGSKNKATMVDEQRKESKDDCLKCREIGQMAWQCLKRNLYANVEAQEAPIGEDEEGNNSGSEFGPLNVDDLEEVEEDTSLLSVVKRIIATPKQEEDWSILQSSFSLYFKQ